MNDKIELLLTDYDFDLFSEKHIQDSIHQLKKDVEEITKNIKIDSDDIGQGVNIPVILISLVGIALMGQQINDCIDGWLGLASKFKNVLGKLKSRHHQILISENAAKLIAVEHISKEISIESLDIFMKDRIVLYGREGSRSTEIASCPACIYVFNIVVNNRKSYCIAIRSNGNIEFNIKYEHPIDLILD